MANNGGRQHELVSRLGAAKREAYLVPFQRIKFHGHDNTLASDLMMVLSGDVPPALRPHLTHSITCSSIVLP